MSIQSEDLRARCAHVAHRAGCGKCEICMAADQVEQLEIKNVELEKQRDTLLSACEGLIAWDKRRGFPIPYKVRDPIHAAIASMKEQA